MEKPQECHYDGTELADEARTTYPYPTGVPGRGDSHSLFGVWQQPLFPIAEDTDKKDPFVQMNSVVGGDQKLPLSCCAPQSLIPSSSVVGFFGTCCQGGFILHSVLVFPSACVI